VVFEGERHLQPPSFPSNKRNERCVEKQERHRGTAAMNIMLRYRQGHDRNEANIKQEASSLAEVWRRECSAHAL